MKLREASHGGQDVQISTDFGINQVHRISAPDGWEIMFSLLVTRNAGSTCHRSGVNSAGSGL